MIDTDWALDVASRKEESTGDFEVLRALIVLLCDEVDRQHDRVRVLERELSEVS